MNISIMLLDGYSYPRSPKEFKFGVHVSKGMWSGWASALISEVPPEIWTMDGEQAKAHPFIAALIDRAQADMKANIAKAMEEAS